MEKRQNYSSTPYFVSSERKETGNKKDPPNPAFEFRKPKRNAKLEYFTKFLLMVENSSNVSQSLILDKIDKVKHYNIVFRF